MLQPLKATPMAPANQHRASPFPITEKLNPSFP